MIMSLRATALYGASLAALLLLSACGKSEPATPNDTPAPASTTPVAMIPPPTTSAPATVASIPSSPSSGMASAASTATPASAASSAPPAAPLSVTKLTLGSNVDAEHQVTRASDSFASNDKTIYASVATEGSSSGATLNAKWSYLEGSGQLVSSISQSIATDGPATTTFKVQNPDLWPEGKYKVEISLDGKPVTSQNFQIRKR